jgi:hypothetical protein
MSDYSNDELHEFVRELMEKFDALGCRLSRYGNSQSDAALASASAGAAAADASGGSEIRDFDLRAIRRAAVDIEASGIWSPLKNITKRYGTSYGQKHLLERWRRDNPTLRSGGEAAVDCYVTNGDFIMAMLSCGYRASFRYDGALQVNCRFNAKVQAPAQR